MVFCIPPGPKVPYTIGRDTACPVDDPMEKFGSLVILAKLAVLQPKS